MFDLWSFRYRLRPVRAPATEPATDPSKHMSPRERVSSRTDRIRARQEQQTGTATETEPEMMVDMDGLPRPIEITGLLPPDLILRSISRDRLEKVSGQILLFDPCMCRVRGRQRDRQRGRTRRRSTRSDRPTLVWACRRSVCGRRTRGSLRSIGMPMRIRLPVPPVLVRSRSISVACLPLLPLSQPFLALPPLLSPPDLQQRPLMGLRPRLSGACSSAHVHGRG